MDNKELQHYRKLHEGLSDMVESGRLQQADIPEDFGWLVSMLSEAVGFADKEGKVDAVAQESGWDDHPVFPRADWQQEVACGDTCLGYVDWCQHQAERVSFEEYQADRLVNGYDVFECDGQLVIQRLDDPEMVRNECGIVVCRRHESDAEAIKFVTVRAEQGDRVAIDALRRTSGR